jgi:DNA-binding Lrp family transcriptional regulator
MQSNINGKLDFFSVFNDGFNSETVFHVEEQVKVQIKCVKFDQLDKRILYILLNEGSKRIDGNEVTCRIEAALLMNRVGLSEPDLYNRIRKLLSLGLNEYTQFADAEYNFCVIKTLSETGKRVAYEVTFDHLTVLKTYFNEEFIELLTGNADKGPSGAHKLVAKEKELFFLSYMDAFNYGKKELRPQPIDYQIYRVQTNELVFAAESFHFTQKEMDKDIRRPQVSKLNFMDIFNSESQKDDISVGINEDVVVTIECPVFTSLDRVIFTTIWSSGEKSAIDDTIVSTISEKLLNSHVPTFDYNLEEALVRLSRVSIGVKYAFEGERVEGRYNIFDVAISSDGDGRVQAITMGVKSLMTLGWLFSEESLKILKV